MPINLNQAERRGCCAGGARLVATSFAACILGIGRISELGVTMKVSDALPEFVWRSPKLDSEHVGRKSYAASGTRFRQCADSVREALRELDRSFEVLRCMPCDCGTTVALGARRAHSLLLVIVSSC